VTQPVGDVADGGVAHAGGGEEIEGGGQELLAVRGRPAVSLRIIVAFPAGIL